MAKKKIVNSVPRFIPPDKLSAAADRQRRISSRRRSRSGSLININETQVSRTSPSFERISVGDPIVRSVGIHGLGEENRVNDSCNGLPSVTSKGLSRVSLNHYFLLSRVATNGELETVDFSIGLSDLDPRFSMLGSDCNQNQFTPDPTASTSQGGCFSDYCSGFQGPYMSQPSYPYATHVAEPSPQPQQVAQENLDPLPSQRYGIDDQRHMSECRCIFYL
ncbi:hypothetical protein CCACVL1_28918 [Corchorus capsularis]|uniref:Uncharacterized protein n=1 Tax=Corchorus capsularis TaxID=210143 RepID=A0A1R3G4N0_COCAP|nr:hypothetical protein CCACVL1_28918 [Corchorus capsularis]